jgi:nitroreductase
MELYETLNIRRSIREFQSKTVEPEKLQRILEAGLKTPSHNHLREWEFILVNDFDRRRIIVEQGACAKNYDEQEIEKAVCSMSEWEKPAYLAALPVQEKMLMTAPQLLVVCFRMKKSLRQCDSLYDLNNFIDLALY